MSRVENCAEMDNDITKGNKPSKLEVDPLRTEKEGGENRMMKEKRKVK